MMIIIIIILYNNMQPIVSHTAAYAFDMLGFESGGVTYDKASNLLRIAPRTNANAVNCLRLASAMMMMMIIIII